MPRRPHKRRGRKRKFADGDVAWSDKYGWVVIVGRILYSRISYYYKIVRVMHPYNGAPYGEAIVAKSTKLHKPGPEVNPRRKTVPPIYRANVRLGKLSDRGCRCNCCVHTSIKPGDVRKDGTFVWEEQEDEQE